jgi:transposase
MRFYTNHHQFYCGIDLHARQMYVCVLDQEGEVLFHRNMPTDPDHLVHVVSRFGSDMVIGVECIFSWYWLADFCDERNIPFALGHALYMKAIHGGKTKNDRIDSHKIASLLRGGMFPLAYVYPKEMRATRDLLRRREYFVHQQSELFAHLQNTNTQYNLPPFEKCLRSAANRKGIEEGFTDPSVKKSVEADLSLLNSYHRILLDLESQIQRQAKEHDPIAFHLLRTIPGVGPILALVILYEIHDIHRFPSVGNFISYARLVKCAHESAGKRMKGGNNKIGNAHLKWAFSEAAVLFLRENEPAKRMHEKLVGKYGKAKSLSIIAQKLGRLVYYMLKHKEPFSRKRFFGDGAQSPAA